MITKIFATGVVADQPTRNGNIFTRECLERAVKEFNSRSKTTPIPGSMIDRGRIEFAEPITHTTRSLFINDSGLLCAEVKVIDQTLIDEMVDSDAFIARPVISIPAFELKHQPLMVSNINSIVRIQLERVDEPTGSKNADKEGGVTERSDSPDAGPPL